MTAAATLDLPLVDPAILAMHNELAGTARSLALPLVAGQAVVRFTPPDGPFRGLAAAATLGGRRLWIVCDDWNQFDAVDALLDGGPADRTPGAILTAVLSAAFEPALDAVARAAGGCDIDSVVPAEGLPNGLTTLGAELPRDGAAPLRVTLAADEACWGLVRQLVCRLPPTAERSLADLRLTAGVEVGLTQLSFDEVRSLRRGDVVLLDVSAPRDKPAGLLRFAPTATWRASLGEAQVTLLEPVKLAHWGRDAAGGLDVALVFEQGRVDVSAAEVAALQPGAVLPWLEGDQVIVRNGGRSIGAGELVVLGNRVGVRLLNPVIA